MKQDQDGNWHIEVMLMDETKRLLDELVSAIGGDTTPAMLAASLLHDVLEEDAEAHLSPENFRLKGSRLH